MHVDQLNSIELLVLIEGHGSVCTGTEAKTVRLRRDTALTEGFAPLVCVGGKTHGESWTLARLVKYANYNVIADHLPSMWTHTPREHRLAPRAWHKLEPEDTSKYRIRTQRVYNTRYKGQASGSSTVRLGKDVMINKIATDKAYDTQGLLGPHVLAGTGDYLPNYDDTCRARLRWRHVVIDRGHGILVRPLRVLQVYLPTKLWGLTKHRVFLTDIVGGVRVLIDRYMAPKPIRVLYVWTPCRSWISDDDPTPVHRRIVDVEGGHHHDVPNGVHASGSLTHICPSNVTLGLDVSQRPRRTRDVSQYEREVRARLAAFASFADIEEHYEPIPLQ